MPCPACGHTMSPGITHCPTCGATVPAYAAIFKSLQIGDMPAIQKSPLDVPIALLQSDLGTAIRGTSPHRGEKSNEVLWNEMQGQLDALYQLLGGRRNIGAYDPHPKLARDQIIALMTTLACFDPEFKATFAKLDDAYPQE